MDLDPSLPHRAGGLEFFANLTLPTGGIPSADAINTVSKGYAREIQTPELGFGLDGLLRSRSDALTGIANGVDYLEWSRERDPFIPRNYGAESLDGKRECKRSLIAEFGLPAGELDRPVIGIVSRFAPQKGFDLIAAIARPE